MNKRMVASGLVLLSMMALARPAEADESKDREVGVADLRVAFGPALHVLPRSEQQVSVGVDFDIGATIVVKGSGDMFTGLVLNPEVGYTHDSVGLHAFNLTFGVGGGNALFAATYQPRLLVGRQDDDFAIGVRNSLQLKALADIFSFEVGHQLVYDNELHHSVQFLFGVNPGAFLSVLVFFASGFGR